MIGVISNKKTLTYLITTWYACTTNTLVKGKHEVILEAFVFFCRQGAMLDNYGAQGLTYGHLISTNTDFDTHTDMGRNDSKKIRIWIQ